MNLYYTSPNFTCIVWKLWNVLLIALYVMVFMIVEKKCFTMKCNLRFYGNIFHFIGNGWMQTYMGNLPILVKGFIAGVHIEPTRLFDWCPVSNLRHCWLDRNEPPALVARTYKPLQLHGGPSSWTTVTNGGPVTKHVTNLFQSKVYHENFSIKTWKPQFSSRWRIPVYVNTLLLHVLFIFLHKSI